MVATPAQQRIMQVLSEVLSRYGFALGGGQAMNAYGLIDRPTRDLDYYVNKFEEKPFEEATAAVFAKISEIGGSSRIISQLGVFTGIQVVVGGETVSIDLGYDYRKSEPIALPDFGAVLEVEDLAQGKIRALLERGAVRDVADVCCIIARSGIPLSRLSQIAKHEVIGREEQTDAALRAALKYSLKSFKEARVPAITVESRYRLLRQIEPFKVRLEASARNSINSTHTSGQLKHDPFQAQGFSIDRPEGYGISR